MNSYLDDALVGVLLLVSAAYVFSALGPRHLRRRVLAACSAGLRRAPAALGMRRLAQRIAHAAETKPQGACGGCDNCGSEGAATRAPGTRTPLSATALSGTPRTPLSGTTLSGAATEIAATEIKVPIASIGRARR